MRTFLTLCFVTSSTLSVHALDVVLFVQQHSYCGRASGIIYANVTGGVPPYTYLWSDGSSGLSLNGVNAGMYSLTVTDSQLDQATGDGEVLLLNSYDYQSNNPPGIMHCPGDPMQTFVYTGMDQVGVQPLSWSIYGPNPYSFDAPGLTHVGQSTVCADPNGVVYELLNFTGISPGPVTVAYTDANGCPGTMDLYVAGPMTWPNVQVLDVVPSCPNWGTGSIVFSYQPTDPMGVANVSWRADGDPTSCGNQISQTYLANGYIGTITNLSPGDHWLIISNDLGNLYEGSAYSYLECKDSILVNVPAMNVDCGRVTGRLYIDENADCIAAGGENRIPNSIIEVTPGPSYTTTDDNGQYTVYLPYGTYSIVEQNAVYEQSCPADVTITTGNSQTVNIGCTGGVPLDVQVSMANGPARPGFELQYAVDLDNLTSGSPGDVTFSLDLDPNLTWSYASPSPTSVNGNTLTWTTPELVMNTVFAHRDINVHATVPSDVGLIGTTLVTTATLVTTNTDADPSNNTAISNQLVTGSYDPNDKVATTSSGASATQYFIDGDEWIDYTIRFQNTGTDTAFNVIITDTLPTTLDASSVQWGATSHTCTRTISGAGVLKFIFAGILLPDSNANEAASHGFVSFRIKPVEPVQVGSTLENSANIYFDFNDPIITEPSVLVAEFSTGMQEQAQGQGQVRLLPNPVEDQLTVSSSGIIGLIRIISADGREVVRWNSGGGSASIDVKELKSGAYLLIAELNNGTSAHARFIKH
ncbi:MAG: T9SS type A sorting domain-containing protein [Flavobacteriales bacterium]